MPEAKSKGPYNVYILECENGSFYTGIALDMEDRLQRHLRRTDHSKYTRSFKIKRLAVCWEISGVRGDAQKVESLIKRRGRKFKEAVIAQPSSLEETILRELDLKIKHIAEIRFPDNRSGDGITC